ncbi:MAG: zinc-ribbon domain-containing protein [Clostridia bacterium]|nr:zinc-ribbon domain-containing protein [Clostridia bacterium]
MSKICTNCSAQLSDVAKFCSKCGQRVPEEVVSDLHIENEEQKQEAECVQPEQPQVEQPVESEPAEEVIQPEQEVLAQEVQPEQPQYEQPAQPSPAVADAPVMTPKDMKKAMKQQLKASKEAEKEAKKAEIEAKKSEAAQQKAMYKQNLRATKVTALGVLAAIVLSVFLVLNLVACFALSLCLGVTCSDASDIEVSVGSEVMPVDNLLESVGGLNDEKLKELAESLLDENGDIVIKAGDKNFSMHIAEETLNVTKEVVLSESGVSGMILDSVEKYMGVARIGVLSAMGYVAIVVIILVVLIMLSLARKRRAFVLPGIIFLLVGLVSLVASAISVILPDVIGQLGLDSILSLNNLVACALITSATMSVIGVIFVAIGATAKKRA